MTATTPPRNHLFTSKLGKSKNSSPTSVTHSQKSRSNHPFHRSITQQQKSSLLPSTYHSTTPIPASITNTPLYTSRDINLILSKVATLTQWLTQPGEKIQEYRKTHKRVSLALLMRFFSPMAWFFHLLFNYMVKPRSCSPTRIDPKKPVTQVRINAPGKDIDIKSC